MSGPSQPKVEDEQWNDERLKGFLLLKPLDESDHDFHVLLQAYRHMTCELFVRFLPFFVAEKRNLQAASLQGETILEHIGQHEQSSDYAEALKAVGA